nr:gonadotropin releasing hormone [Anadara broughtonii]
MTSNMKATKQSIYLLLSLSLIYITVAQNYHFSNGWEPGKRSQQMCEFRPQIKNLVLRLIEDEIERFRKCSSGSGFGEIIDLMQNKPAVIPGEK